MMFQTGLEELLEKIALALQPGTIRPAVQGSPFPRAPSTSVFGRAPSPWARPTAGEFKSRNAGAAYASQVHPQQADPLMREALQAGQQNFAAHPGPGAAGVTAPSRPGFWRRAAVPIGLAAGGAMLGANLMSGYNDDQRYNNLAYAPLGPNAV